MKYTVSKRILVGMILGVFIAGSAVPALAVTGPGKAAKIPAPVQTVSPAVDDDDSENTGNSDSGSSNPGNSSGIGSGATGSEGTAGEAIQSSPMPAASETVKPVNPGHVPQPALVRPIPPRLPKVSNSGPGNIEAAKKNFRGSIDKLREIRKQPKETADSGLERQRAVLLRLINALIDRGLWLEEKVKNLNPPRGELEESILKEIADDRVMLEAFKKEAEEADTRDELKAIAKRIQEKHKDFTNKKVRVLLLAIFFGRLEKQYTKNLEARAGRIEKKLDELEAQGKDVTQLRQLLAQAKALIANILTTINEKRAELNQSDLSDVRLKELREILENIKKEIRKVHQIFQEIYEGIENL